MGGTNLYQYAPNPTGWIDPLGLMTSRVDPPEGCDCDGDGEDDTYVDVTYEIDDGVRRSKATEINGKETINANIMEDGKIIENKDIPVNSLLSPHKDSLDLAEGTGANMDRYMDVQEAIQNGDKLPPIQVRQGSNGTPIKDVDF